MWGARDSEPEKAWEGLAAVKAAPDPREAQLRRGPNRWGPAGSLSLNLPLAPSPLRGRTDSADPAGSEPRVGTAARDEAWGGALISTGFWRLGHKPQISLLLGNVSFQVELYSLWLPPPPPPTATLLLGRKWLYSSS